MANLSHKTNYDGISIHPSIHPYIHIMLAHLLLARMWRNRNPSMLLVGMQTDEATVKGLVVSQKVELNYHIIDSIILPVGL